MYFINKYPGKENAKTGTFVDIVRDVLKGELSRVKVALDEKAKRLREKLDDKYTEEYDDIQNAIIELYRKGMHENATKKDVTGLLIAIETSCGTRKGGIIDPNVEFYSFQQWRAKRTKNGFPETVFGFGKEDDDDAFLKMDEAKFIDTFQNETGMEHVIVQKGVLKSKEEAINKYLDAGDDRWIMQRAYSKPCLVLTAKEIVKGVRRFRSYFDLKKSTFRGRRIESNNFGSNQIRPIMSKYFSQSMAKANANGWNFGTHHGRRCYAVAAWGIYGDQVQMVTSKYIDRSRFMSKILFHDPNSLNTYLSYNTVVVQFKMSEEVFKSIPKERERDLYALIQNMQNQIDDLKKNIQNKNAIDLVLKDSMLIAFVDRQGENVTIRKRQKRTYKSTSDRDTEIQLYKTKLLDSNVEVSISNLQRLGFSKNTINDFSKRKPIIRKKKKEKSETFIPIEEEKTTKTMINDRSLREGTSKIVEGQLEPGSKIIANTNKKVSDNAKKQQIKRARETFGEDKVIENIDECNNDTNEILTKKLKTDKGTTLTREICQPKR